jgi:hypothetical protein
MSQGKSILLLSFKVANVSDSMPVAIARLCNIYTKFQTPRKQQTKCVCRKAQRMPLNPSDVRFKGIDRSFRRGVKISLIRSLFINWRLGKFFSSHFKGISSQDEQKTNRRRLIIPKVTLTGQSDFMRIFVLGKVTLRNYTNSVQ